MKSRPDSPPYRERVAPAKLYGRPLPKPKALVVEGLAAASSAMIERCLDIDPAERPTAEDLAAAALLPVK